MLRNLCLSGCIVVLASACKTTVPVSSGVGAESVTNEIPPATYLKVDNAMLAERVIITDAKYRTTNELLEVNVELSSQFEKSQKLQYHFNWFDGQGFIVEPAKSPWKPLDLHGHQTVQLKGVAPSPKVTSFNVYVRNASSNAYEY